MTYARLTEDNMDCMCRVTIISMDHAYIHEKSVLYLRAATLYNYF